MVRARIRVRIRVRVGLPAWPMEQPVRSRCLWDSAQVRIRIRIWTKIRVRVSVRDGVGVRHIVVCS